MKEEVERWMEQHEKKEREEDKKIREIKRKQRDVKQRKTKRQRMHDKLREEPRVDCEARGESLTGVKDPERHCDSEELRVTETPVVEESLTVRKEDEDSVVKPVVWSNNLAKIHSRI